MSTEASTEQTMSHLARRRVLLRSIPLFLALLMIGVIYYVVSAQYALGPRGLILGLIVLLVIVLAAAFHAGHVHLSRSVSIILLGVVTLAEAISTSALIADLIATPVRMNELSHDTALLLLRDAALIWLVNILTFAFWYWELDGGPARRQHAGYASSDFIFPQATLESSRERTWQPHFVDYLFFAFNTSTAFSPTDTQPLSIRVKLLMMLQSLISLIVIAIIAARAINTL